MKKYMRLTQSASRSTNLLRSGGLVLLGFVLAGCPSGNPGPTATGGDKVIIKGSNTVGEELAPRLIAEFKKNHPTVAFELESKGTGYGFGNLLAGACDIAAASRVANENEHSLARSRDIALKECVIGSYAVAVVVNVANPVTNLTRGQVRDIFAGTIQNWKDLGGHDAPIRLYIRDPISGTHLGFREIAMENKPYAVELKTFTNYAGIVQALAKDAAGIGYSSLDLATSPGVKGVAIEGVSPVAAAVNQGKYPYSRLLHFYTNKARESSAAREFLEFVQSQGGQRILVGMGYVPKP